MVVKKTNYLITFQLICIFLSCARSSEKSFKQKYEDKDGFKIIKIEESIHVEAIKDSEFIKKIDYIRLETNPDCLIGEIDKISVDSKYIYILDRFVANALFVFKKNGEFVKKIGHFGRGPGEYTKIWDFKVLEDNKLIVLDIYIRKVFFFDNLNYTHHKRIERLELLNSITKNGPYYYAKLLKNINFSLLILDENLNVLEDESSRDLERTNPIGSKNDFIDYRDSITFMKKFASKIYRIKGTKIIPKYYFDFGNKQLTFKAVNNYKNYGKDLVDKFNFIGEDFYESKSYILFGANYKGGGTDFFLYNKNTDVLKYSELFRHDLDKGFSMRHISGNDKYILGKIDAKYILKDKDKEIKRKLGLLGVNENDNPIITISYFK